MTNHDPEFELKETVIISNAPAGENTVTIVDKQADMTIKLPNGSTASPENEDEMNPHFVRLKVNRDFDLNQFGQQPDNTILTPNSQHSSRLKQDNDLASFTTTSYFKFQNDVAEDAEDMLFRLNYSDTQLSIWQETDGHLSEYVDPGETNIDLTAGKFWVQGNSAGTGHIQLVYSGDADPTNWINGDQIAFSITDVDLDIDSDNSGLNEAPSRSNWEEILEDHDYGIGKILIANPPEFTPLEFTVHSDGQTQVSFHRDGNQTYSALRLWNRQNNAPGAIDPAYIEDGGHRIRLDTKYNSEQIDSVFLQAVSAKTAHDTKLGVDEHGKPNDFLRIVGYSVHESEDADGNPVEIETEVGTDKVRILVTEADNTLYPALQFEDRKFKNLLAADAVYSAADLKAFGHEKLSIEQIRNILTKDPEKADQFSDLLVLLEDESDNDLRLEIYRDYLSPEGKTYIVAFQGTNMTSPQDWLNNIFQANGTSGNSFLEIFASQYTRTMEISRRLANLISPNSGSGTQATR